MLKRQKEEEAEKKKNEEKLVEAVLANINESDEVAAKVGVINRLLWEC